MVYREINNNVFTQYLSMYIKGFRLNQIASINNETYKILKESDLDIRVVNTSSVYKELIFLDRFKYFSKINKSFYMIPIQTIKGTITGFIIRGVYNKHYHDVSIFIDSSKEDIRLKKVPQMFGFGSGFDTYDKHKDCKPIIICEGLKDCIILKKFYPYVLAMNTNRMGFNSKILRNITDKLLLIYDNDSAGIKSMEADKISLSSQGFYVDCVKTNYGLKDISEYYLKDKQYLKVILKNIKSKLTKLNNI